MPIYDLIIYDRYGQCLIHRPFNQADIHRTTATARIKMLFSLISTMQSFSNQLSPAPGISHHNPEPLFSFATPSYNVFQYTSPTSLHFVLVTDIYMKLRSNVFCLIYQLFVRNILSTPYYIQGCIPNPNLIPPIFETQLTQILSEAAE